MKHYLQFFLGKLFYDTKDTYEEIIKFLIDIVITFKICM